MPAKNDDYNGTRFWFRQVDGDLAIAAARSQKFLPEHKCFHAQQAAEKALKAVCVSRGIVFSKTHKIAPLIGELRKGGVAVPESLDEARHLSGYAVRPRYENADPVTESERREAVGIARAVVKWAKAEVARTEKS